MDKWMDGRVDRWMDAGWKNGRMYAWMNNWLVEWMDEWMEAEDRSACSEREGQRAQHGPRKPPLQGQAGPRDLRTPETTPVSPITVSQ